MESEDPKIKDADLDAGGEGDESDSTGSDNDERLTPIEDDTSAAAASSATVSGFNIF